MNFKSLVIATAIVASLTACDAFRKSSEDGLPLSEVKLDGRAPIAQSAVTNARYTIKSVEITVPDTLRVSEENLFYPNADVVWRGDPAGDRLAQVKAILEEATAKGVAGMATGPDAILALQLERFHALTEKARFSVGGVHDVVWVLTVLDPKTRAVLEGPRRVEIAIRAGGGNVAIAEDAEGRTQRVVILEGVEEAVRRELTGPAPTGRSVKPRLFAGFN